MSKLLMIPGPVELSPAVLESLSQPSQSHVSAEFIGTFARVLEQLLNVFLTDSSTMPFVIGGSGTIAMEMAALNTCQPNDRAIVMNSGYFGDRMERVLRRRGVHVISIKSEKIGEHPSLRLLEETLQTGDFKAVFGTHVDTSTGVCLDVEQVAFLANSVGVLSVIDGVCAAGGEEFRMEEWGVDVYFTASQKALGLPPGLAIMTVSQRALQARKQMSFEPPLSIDWLEWLPIMENYLARKESYFSTPPVSLIQTLDTSLNELLSIGMEKIFELHSNVATRIQMHLEKNGFQFVSAPAFEARTMTAAYCGEHREIVAQMKKHGVIIAGGLLPEIKDEYFRIGHMGYSVRHREHIDRLLDTLDFIIR